MVLHSTAIVGVLEDKATLERRILPRFAPYLLLKTTKSDMLARKYILLNALVLMGRIGGKISK